MHRFGAFITALLLLGSCRPPEKEPNVEAALTFLNNYTANCNKAAEATDVVTWVNNCNLVTTAFKSELKKLDDEARQREPQVGLDADPIFDAQYFPEEGFAFKKNSETKGFLIFCGINHPEFTLTLKVVHENNAWLVDGCGMVRIPKSMRKKP